MSEYNQEKLKKHKEGFLGIYYEKLKELQKGEIPIGFETYVKILNAAVPYFPEEEQIGLKEILSIGLTQLKYLRAKEIVDAIKDEEEKRLEKINGFLASFEDNNEGSYESFIEYLGHDSEFKGIFKKDIEKKKRELKL